VSPDLVFTASFRYAVRPTTDVPKYGMMRCKYGGKDTWKIRGVTLLVAARTLTSTNDNCGIESYAIKAEPRM